MNLADPASMENRPVPIAVLESRLRVPALKVSPPAKRLSLLMVRLPVPDLLISPVRMPSDALASV